MADGYIPSFFETTKIPRARSTPVVYLHGMERKGVQFPSGPLLQKWQGVEDNAVFTDFKV